LASLCDKIQSVRHFKTSPDIIGFAMMMTDSSFHFAAAVPRHETAFALPSAIILTR
jgi:hypothetical protein